LKIEREGCGLIMIERIRNLFFKVEGFLRCPKCLSPLELSDQAEYLICMGETSHRFPIIDGIPSFVKREEISPEDARWIFEYDEKAEKYDENIKIYDVWLGVDLWKEGVNVLKEIPIEPYQRILDVSTGTGAVILRMIEAHPNASLEFVGTDLSIGMLRVAQRKFERLGLEVPLFHSHVNELPFESESFDVITHFGGINTFRDIASALKEWVRLLKPNGFLLIADEGLSPTVRKTQRGLKIVERNRLFGLQPPLQHLPPQLKNVKLWWFAKDTFYAILCQKLSKEELKELKTNGTEHIRIKELVEEMLQKLKA